MTGLISKTEDYGSRRHFLKGGLLLIRSKPETFKQNPSFLEILDLKELLLRVHIDSFKGKKLNFFLEFYRN